MRRRDVQSFKQTGLHRIDGVLVVVLLGVTFSSCGTSGKTSGNTTASMSDLHKVEAEFDPSQYNPEVEGLVKKETPGQNPTEPPVGVTNPAPPELVQGFRVQIHASTSIDQTSKKKALAEEQFPDEWFYMVYDPPTYKLRAGNFLTRFEADRFLKELKEAGFLDSWIVPDRVTQNPGPRQQQPPQDPPQE